MYAGPLASVIFQKIFPNQKHDDEGFEQLANIINFRVSGGIFLQWNL